MKNKKAFSLPELLLVIAIIVILAGTTTIGVVSWLNSAKDTEQQLKTNNGENFESEARNVVASVVPTAPSYVIQKESLDDNNTGDDGFDDEWWAKNDAEWQAKIDALIKDGCPQDQIKVVRNADGHIVGVSTDWKPDSNNGSGENGSGENGSGENGSGENGSGENGSGENGSGNQQGGATVDTTPGPAGAPDLVSTRPAGSAHVADTLGSNVSGASIHADYNNGKFKYPSGAKSIVVHIPEGYGFYDGSYQSLGNGFYRVSNPPSNGEYQFYKKDYTQCTATEKANIYVVEYVT